MPMGYFFQKILCPVKIFGLKKDAHGLFFPKVNNALPKDLNTRKIFGIKKRWPWALFFPKMHYALQKYLNTRKIFGIKKDAHGLFFPKMHYDLPKHLNTRKIFSIKKDANGLFFSIDALCPVKIFEY